MISLLEQYSIVLHNLSLRQHRMVKFSELRCCSGVRYTLWFSRPVCVIKQLQKIFPIVSLYPEFMHRLVLFNTFPGLARHVELFKNFSRRWFSRWFKEQFQPDQFERDHAKVWFCRVGDWPRLHSCFTARCVLEWANAIERNSDEVPCLAVATRALWVETGGIVAWSCLPLGARAAQRMRFEVLFFPEVGNVIFVGSGPGAGQYVSKSSGAFLIVADNTSSWFTSKNAILRLEVAPVSNIRRRLTQIFS